MNLQLEQISGAHVLRIKGDVDLKGTGILRAGVAKLLKSGKDKIIIDMSGVGGLHERFVDEIKALHHLASELTGKIVVAGAPENVTARIKAYADPPPFPVIQSVEEAISFLKQLGSLTEELPPEIAALLKARDARIQALESQIQLSNPEGLRELRAENEALRESTRLLEARVTELMNERRLPPDAESVIERIAGLERNVKEMTAAQGAHAKK